MGHGPLSSSQADTDQMITMDTHALVHENHTAPAFCSLISIYTISRGTELSGWRGTCIIQLVLSSIELSTTIGSYMYIPSFVAWHGNNQDCMMLTLANLWI